MARYALINAGIVESVADGDAAWAAAVDADWDDVVMLADGASVGRGHTYSGGEFAPPVVPTVVPQAVTMRQARLALLGAGLLSSVDAAIENMSDPTRSAARIEWEYSNELQRSNQLLLALGPALGLSPQQIDDLFVAASAL